MVLSQAIRSIVAHHGTYVSVVRGAKVTQPVVSLALHQRLVAKTPAVERLFEYLNIEPQVGDAPTGDAATSIEADGRTHRLLGMLEGLSDGSKEGDERLATVLAALRGFRPEDAC